MLLFFDHNESFVKDYRDTMGTNPHPNLKVYYASGDVKELCLKYKVQAIVSPANSFGFMNGGIDAVYMHMFPGIEARTQKRIKEFFRHKSSTCIA